MLGTIDDDLAMLAEGRFTPLDAKTAVGVLRYRPEEVVAVIDSTRAGRTAQACVGVGGAIPVVATSTAPRPRGADSAADRRRAPGRRRCPRRGAAVVREALERGWDVLSGLHAFLGGRSGARRARRASAARG